VGADSELFGYVAPRQQLVFLALGIKQPGVLQTFRIHRGAIVEMGKLVQVDAAIVDLEYVLEALLVGQTLNQLQLAALEAGLGRAALSGVLAFLTTARSLDPA